MTPHAASIRPRFRFQWLADPGRRPIDWLDDDTWIPDGRRRVYRWAKQGLTVAFETLDAGETVLLPAYVPGGVTWAALHAGLDVRYYPVAADLTLPVGEISRLIRTVEPAAVQFIHYFGFVDEGFDSLVSVAREHGALVVEDCARGLFGRDENGTPLGSRGDLAVFCPHKTLPVPDGGIAVSRNGLELPEPSPTRDWRHDARYLLGSLRDRVPVDVVPDAVFGRSHTGEVDDVEPEEALAGASPLTAFGLARCRPAVVSAKRRARYRCLRGLLDGRERFRVVTGTVHEGACPYGVVGVLDSEAERDELFRGLRSAGLPSEVLTWPPVHRREEVRGFEGAERLRKRSIVFPTHQQLSWATVGRLAAHVAEWE
ncbi:DegT/DnrJ/EryC1/StrS family aminotransferase [Halobellus rufus]|uniref:DegT/DnrJ/EryC1/StrS family aminotransferase n=1 Tax=Halobellus rufus TaxID=1448860 RepID=UPI00067870C9|nr:DegT/DnrJ/EryC1/StrS family aminotransferase [Halobellus rufus]